MVDNQCEVCGLDVRYPFNCNYCGRSFCVKHHLPENHDCSQIHKTSPPGRHQPKDKLLRTPEKEADRDRPSPVDPEYTVGNSKKERYDSPPDVEVISRKRSTVHRISWKLQYYSLRTTNAVKYVLNTIWRSGLTGLNRIFILLNALMGFIGYALIIIGVLSFTADRLYPIERTDILFRYIGNEWIVSDPVGNIVIIFLGMILVWFFSGPFFGLHRY